MAEPKLVILSVPVQNEKRYEFDVLAAAKDTVDGLTILDPKKNSGAILFGQLAPFYTRLKNELMDHMFVEYAVKKAWIMCHIYLDSKMSITRKMKSRSN